MACLSRSALWGLVLAFAFLCAGPAQAGDRPASAPSSSIASVSGAAGGSAKAKPVTRRDGTEPAEIFTWLFKEPVTLMDAGMMRLQQDLNGATRFAAMRNRDLRGWQTGVYYVRREKRVLAYVTVVASARADRTQTMCKALFNMVHKALMINGPEGPGRTSWYLNQTFGHQGSAWSFGQPRDLGEVLSEHVFLRISLLPSDYDMMNAKAKRAACEGPLGGRPQELARLTR